MNAALGHGAEPLAANDVVRRRLRSYTTCWDANGAAVYVYQSGRGYVGFGRVVAPAKMARDAVVNGTPLLSQPREQLGLSRGKDDPETAEYVVMVEWRKTVPLTEAKTFVGAFANQNVVCRLRHPATIEFLHREFGELS